MAATLSGCRTCQRRLLESVLSLSGLTLASPRVQPIHTRPQSLGLVFAPVSRPFSTNFRRQEQDQRLPIAESLTQSVDVPQSKTPLTSTSNADHDAAIPWYLRVSTPPPLSPQNFPNPALQDTPPLPADPPLILESILTHLSISTGLDALTILDLRNLSPPSALGSNLIMILGTARSEKHLNTSADRFCRWIRSTYKFRPYADGLLGRNELKLKMRRRNKKLKLARSVGNTMFDAEKGYDDGITTGWICCNLGAVDVAQIPEEEQTAVEIQEDTSTVDAQKPSDLYQIFSQKDQERPLEDEEEYSNPADEDFTYRGFGSSVTAPRIVVQMFTEQKRAEMDLEGLWESRIKRRDEKEQRQDQLFETSEIEQEIATPGVKRMDEDVIGPNTSR